MVPAAAVAAAAVAATLVPAALVAAALVTAALVAAAVVAAGLLAGALVTAARRLVVTAPVPAPAVTALRLARRGLVPTGWASSRAPCGAPPVSWAPAC